MPHGRFGMSPVISLSSLPVLPTNMVELQIMLLTLVHARLEEFLHEAERLPVLWTDRLFYDGTQLLLQLVIHYAEAVYRRLLVRNQRILHELAASELVEIVAWLYGWIHAVQDAGGFNTHFG